MRTLRYYIVIMKFPVTNDDRLRCIAIETARMSFPSSMSRGKKPVVGAGTKKLVEDYFEKTFPLKQAFSLKDAFSYNKWHYCVTDQLSHKISTHIKSNNVARSVAAKFINTFMHQLAKYPDAHHLLPFLHLPLDSRVFGRLKRLNSAALKKYTKLIKSSPYSLNYRHHIRLQKQLILLISELNNRPNAEFSLQYRIELNWLWL